MRKATSATLVLLLLSMAALSISLTLSHARDGVERQVDQRGLTRASLFEPQAQYTSVSPPVDWNKTYGGSNDDYARSVLQTNDNGYAFVGFTYSYGNGSQDDFWLVKTDSSGNMQWNRTYGGIGNDEAYSLVQTSEGGYALAGYTSSSEVGNEDFWLVKTDSSGNMQWNKTYGGSSNEEAESIVQPSDNGYIIVGSTESFGAGSLDCWAVKTDSNGNMQWNRTYGGTDLDVAYAVQQTDDGGYVIAGYTSSFGAGSFDFWLIKLNANGDEQWSKTYGGTKSDVAYSILQTTDGGYLVAGSTSSSGAGLDDFFLVKTDGLGNQQWNRTYGWTNNDRLFSVVQTKEGGYALGGATNSMGAGSYDFWLVKADVAGNVQWNSTYGGTNWDSAQSVRQTLDAGYIIAGYTFSFGAGGSDAWLMRLTSADVASPLTVNDYDGEWHNADFTITLTATDDLSGVAETYYTINSGSTKSVSADDQPRITVESANNTLTYWSVDNAGHEENPRILTEIKLDKTPPLGSITIGLGHRYVNSTLVDLTLSATDSISGVYQARYSNDGTWDTETWEPFSSTKTWTLLSSDGNKTVYYQVMDKAARISNTVSRSIILDTSPPVAYLVTPLNAESFSTSTVDFNASVTDIESGINRVELYVDNQFRGNMTLASEDTYFLTVSSLNNGDHTWFVIAHNGAGSASTSQARPFTIQTGSQERGLDNPILFYGIIVSAAILIVTTIYYVFKRRKRANQNQ